MNAVCLNFAIATPAKNLSGAGVVALLLIAIVSTAAFVEADKEFERRKAGGDPATAKRPSSWLELTRKFLPGEKKRAYFIFLGVCWIALLVACVLGDFAQ